MPRCLRCKAGPEFIEGSTRADSRALFAVLDALEGMFNQHCMVGTTKDGRRMYDHRSVPAAEDAADVLIEHCRIRPDQLVRP